jgi:hypothetical protein
VFDSGSCRCAQRGGQVINLGVRLGATSTIAQAVPRAHESGRRLHDRDLPMIAHVGPFPIEEPVGAFGPLLIATVGAGLAIVRAHVGRWRQPHHEEVRSVE